MPMEPRNQPTVLVLMGVSGVGKTTIGQAVAERLGWAFYDADAFHPEENVAKMARGEGLTDAERAPWLEALRARIEASLGRGESAVLACSALKERYRARLHADDPRVRFAWLDAPSDVIAERLSGREGHFAGLSLLASQRATLEPPPPGEALHIDARGPAPVVAQAVIDAMDLEG